MRGLGASRILPNHGSREVILSGGYAETLIDATQRYIRDLLLTAGEPLERRAICGRSSPGSSPPAG